MAKEKATITVDRSKLAAVKELTGAPSASAAIDVALTELLRLERLRCDVAAYIEVPQTVEELALATHTPSWTDLADDTDWESLYGADEAAG